MPNALAPWPVTLAQDSPPAAPPTDAPGPGNATPGAPGDTSGTPAIPADPNAPVTNQTQGQGLGSMLPILILVFAVLIIFSMGTGRKEKKRRAAMLATLTKGAKVTTVGGVLGTVVEVRDDEVVVKVDENSNTRMRFAKSAINAVTAEE